MQHLRRFVKSPVAIVSAGLLVRLIYWGHVVFSQPTPAGHLYKETNEIGCIASSIALGHGYSSPLVDPSGPTAWITPVYPYLLAGLYKLFGVFTLQADAGMRLINVLFSALTTYVVYLLGKRLFGEWSGVVAGWIWVFFWYAIFFPVNWLWDTSLSALILTIALWATYAIDEKPDWRAWSGFGLLWGFAVLVNAALLSVFPGCFLFAVYRLRQSGGINPRLHSRSIPAGRPLPGRAWWKFGGSSLWTLAASCALGFVIAVSPWIIRNQIVFHGQVFLRSNFGLELWLGNNPQVPDSWTWWLHPSEDPQEHAKFLRMGEVPYMQEKQHEAWAFIASHPWDVSRFVFHRFIETWTGADSFSDLWNSGLLRVRVPLILNYALPLLTFLGLLLARRKNPLLALPLFNAIALFPMVYYLCHTTVRYRHPIDPIVCILTAYAVVCIVRAVRERFFDFSGATHLEAAST